LKYPETGNNPFILKLIVSDFSMSYSLKYEMANLQYKITLINGLEGERDSVIYSQTLPNNQTVQKILNLNLFRLQNKYENQLVEDGTRLTIIFIINKRAKIISVNNVFQKDIGQLIGFMNDITPTIYQIKY